MFLNSPDIQLVKNPLIGLKMPLFFVIVLPLWCYFHSLYEKIPAVFFLKLPVSLKVSSFFLICSTGRRMPSIILHYFTVWPNSHERDFSDFNLLSLNFTARYSDSSVTYFPISFLTNLYSLKTTLLASFKEMMLSYMATGTGKQNGTCNL